MKSHFPGLAQFILTGVCVIASLLTPLPAQDAVRGRVVPLTHYSPFENLERLDHQQIARAQRTLDIAMYSFTDLYLAQDLKDLATHSHVHIRIYRDGEPVHERTAQLRSLPQLRLNHRFSSWSFQHPN